MTPRATWLCLALACTAWAHRMCDACIPLEDLLMPGYGISVSVHGLSSAAAYHNGTTSALSVAIASEQYRTLMSTVVAQQEMNQLQPTVMRCNERPSLRAQPWDKDILKLVQSSVRRWFHMLQTGRDLLHARPPLDPVTQMLQAQFLALEPFASMNAQLRSRVTLAIQIPAWLMSSPVVGLESPSSAAYTALGYELCRVSHDAFDCTGPGRLATLEYDGHMATASMTKTPILAWDRSNTQYSMLRSSDSLELSRWIDSFLDQGAPDMITLAGTHTEERAFKEALALSEADGRLAVHESIDAQAIMVIGAAQAAKDALENHDSDCGEFNDCLDIRAEADRLAGEYVYTRPSRWPATNNRHWKQWQEPRDPVVGHPSGTPAMLQYRLDL